jgi:translation initiation factor 1A
MKELIYKEDFQMYAKVEKPLGNGRMSVLCDDGVTRIAKIRGSMNRKVWIKKEDVVLVDIREFEKDKVDITHKYTEKEERKLLNYGELPREWYRCDESSDEEVDEDAFVFDDAVDEDAEVDIDAI